MTPDLQTSVLSYGDNLDILATKACRTPPNDQGG